MTNYKFECPQCKYKWTETAWSPEVLCTECNTVWETEYDTYNTWPPENVRIGKKSERQPKFDVFLDGVMIPGCMGIKVERATYKAHSAVEYDLVAEFFGDVDGSLGAGDMEIKLREHPEIKPIRIKAPVFVDGCRSLVFNLDGAGYEFARKQIAALWEKTNGNQ
jgi:hypothetical protein